MPLEVSNVLSSDGQLDKAAYLSYWKGMPDALEVESVLTDAPNMDIKVRRVSQDRLVTPFACITQMHRKQW